MPLAIVIRITPSAAFLLSRREMASALLAVALFAGEPPGAETPALPLATRIIGAVIAASAAAVTTLFLCHFHVLPYLTATRKNRTLSGKKRSGFQHIQAGS
jgi:hypothetical protein